MDATDQHSKKREKSTSKSTFKQSWKARLPIKIADGYLLSGLFAGALRGLMWFGGLLMVFSVMNAMSKVMKYSLPPVILVQLILYQLPRLILFTLPASLLFGAVSAFTEMSASGELTALGVGGMSLSRMLRVPLIFGCVLTVVAFVMQENIVPWGEDNYHVLVHGGLEKLGTQDNFSFVSRGDDGQVERVISAAKFDPASKTLTEPRMQIWNPDRQLMTQIVAQEAHWDEVEGKWRFVDGTQYFFPKAQQENPNRLPSPVISYFDSLEVNTVPDPKLLSDAATTKQEYFNDRKYEKLSLKDLWEERSEQRLLLSATHTSQEKAAITNRTYSLTYGIHDKIATPLMCIAVILLGAPLGVRPQRSGSGFSVGLSLLVLLVYYLVWSAASNIGVAGAPAPIFLGYLPFGIVLVIGISMLWKKSR